MNRYEWGDYFVEEDGTVYENLDEPGPCPQVGEIPQFVAAELLRLARDLGVWEARAKALADRLNVPAIVGLTDPCENNLPDPLVDDDDEGLVGALLYLEAENKALAAAVAEREHEIRLLRKERRLLVDLDIAKSTVIANLIRGKTAQGEHLHEIGRLQADVLALHAEARGGVLLPEGVPCGCLLCAPKRDPAKIEGQDDAPMNSAGPKHEEEN